MVKAVLHSLAAAVLSVLPATLPTSAHAAETLSLTEAVARLPVATESRDGYSRDKFRHWNAGDNPADHTRSEVLIHEAIDPPAVGPGCRLTGGSWFSYYDSTVVTSASGLDIDHMVPLAEAWDSGASAWTAQRRERYANDQGAEPSLVAVTARSNRSKADQDPAEWLPSTADVHCRYLSEWVVTKLRWALAVDDDGWRPRRVCTRRLHGQLCPAHPAGRPLRDPGPGALVPVHLSAGRAALAAAGLATLRPGPAAVRQPVAADSLSQRAQRGCRGRSDPGAGSIRFGPHRVGCDEPLARRTRPAGDGPACALHDPGTVDRLRRLRLALRMVPAHRRLELRVVPAVGAGVDASRAASAGTDAPADYGIEPEWVCVLPIGPAARVPVDGGILDPAQPYLKVGDTDGLAVMVASAAQPLKVRLASVRLVPIGMPPGTLTCTEFMASR